MFHQTFQPHDIVIICVLMVLEAMLSVDNALVLGMLARRLPEEMRGKALTYGLLGALLFRILAIGGASLLLRWRAAEVIGGLYLIYVALQHFLDKTKTDPMDRPALDRQGNPLAIDEGTGKPLTERELGEALAEQTHGQIQSRTLDYSEVHSTHQWRFWLAVAQIELYDVIFAVDSILAAIALIGPAPAGAPTTQPHPKLWVVVAGGMGGVIVMRFAAMVFIRLLQRFPRFELSAYLMVFLIGVKMVIDYLFNSPQGKRWDFNAASDPAAWIFWGLMGAAFGMGFVARRSSNRPTHYLSGA
jgi:YkoY family integral membrane protein